MDATARSHLRAEFARRALNGGEISLAEKFAPPIAARLTDGSEHFEGRVVLVSSFNILVEIDNAIYRVVRQEG